MTKGLIIDSKDVDRTNPDFDTRRPKLQIALQRDPPHLDVVDVAATNLSVNAGNGYYNREDLIVVKHNLGYKPKILLYIYNPGNSTAGSGTGYAVGTFLFGTGAVTDALTYEVDETWFRVYHYVDNTFFMSDFTSSAANFGKMRYKYMIFSNPIDKITNPNRR